MAVLSYRDLICELIVLRKPPLALKWDATENALTRFLW